MGTVAYYRREAQRCREMAAKSTIPIQTRRWQELATDYDQLADALEAQAPRTGALQTQPMQQQQKKTTDRDS